MLPTHMPMRDPSHVSQPVKPRNMMISRKKSDSIITLMVNATRVSTFFLLTPAAAGLKATCPALYRMNTTKYVVDANQYDGATTVSAGPRGSSIREQARLLGWFTWSHLGKMSDKSSCRLRTHRAFIIIPIAIHIIDRLP